ncbi:MAG TPA: hypothetical protein VNV66_04085 [Pilimelia sp.]|nr:hypothetical protein [Pilimelia sp.]
MIGTVSDFTAEALFASNLQASQQPTTAQAWEAVTEAVTRYGAQGFSGRLATAYGDCPETAVARMAWCRGLAAALAAQPAAP